MSLTSLKLLGTNSFMRSFRCQGRTEDSRFRPVSSSFFQDSYAIAGNLLGSHSMPLQTARFNQNRFTKSGTTVRRGCPGRWV